MQHYLEGELIWIIMGLLMMDVERIIHEEAMEREGKNI